LEKKGSGADVVAELPLSSGRAIPVLKYLSILDI
jgi:hypothetical protein